MGREVRRVPAHWEHPKEYNGHRREECYRPMFESSYEDAFNEWRMKELPEWLEHHDKWAEGLIFDYVKSAYVPNEETGTYVEYAGRCPGSPDPKTYMPDWPESERTHFMMYETTSEGTPLSPAFATPEELARWLADNGASSFGSDTATYEQWLRVCKGGYAPSAVMQDGVLQSGVAALTD